MLTTAGALDCSFFSLPLGFFLFSPTRFGSSLTLSLTENSMAEALKLATSQGCRTTTHGGSISRLFSSQPVVNPCLSGIVGCRGNAVGMVGIWPWALVCVCLVIVGLWWCLG
jgi:hypothetical protein